MKFSATTGWDVDCKPLSRLEVWQKEDQVFTDDSMPKLYKPEDNLYAVCYLRVGRSKCGDSYFIGYFVPMVLFKMAAR